MKKLGLLLLMVVLLAGCDSKEKEEAAAMVKEVVCERAALSFTLNGLWSLDEAEEKEQEGRVLEMSATHVERGTGLMVSVDDLTQKEGGTLLRQEDYASFLMEGLKVSKEYSYSCGEISNTVLYGKQYTTFRAEVEELDARQYYYIRRNQDNVIVLVATLYGEDNIQDVLALGKSIEN